MGSHNEIFSRHTIIAHRCGCDEREGTPEADWNRVGCSAFASLEHLERCIVTADVAGQALQRKNASRALGRPDETVRQLRKIRPTCLEAKAVGADKAKYTQTWKDSVAKARNDLGSPGNASAAKGKPLYKKAKEFHDAAKERARA